MCNVTTNDALEFTPGQTNLTPTYVVVSKLDLEQICKIKVISMSNLKNVPKSKWKFAEPMRKPPGLYYEYLFEKAVAYSTN